MFVKFPHIDRIELIDENLLRKFTMADLVIASEKIDGSHITIWIPGNKQDAIEFYTRNGNQFNHFNDADDFKVSCKVRLLEACEKIRDWFLISRPLGYQGIIVDGEIFGKRVMNRLPYGDKTRASLYRCSIKYSDDEYQIENIDTFNSILDGLNLSEYKVHEIKRFNFGVVNNVASMFDMEEVIKQLPLPFQSTYTVEPSKAEGYVVDFYCNGNWIGCFKRKDEAFNDIKIESNILPEDYAFAIDLQKRFAEYALNENRVLDMYSKGYTKLSALIPAVLEDAKEDFLKTHDISRVKDNKQLYKTTFNVGSKLFVLAKKVLHERFGIDY